MQKEKINHSNFEVKMYDFEPIKNSGFIKGKCRVAYAGENRNYTRIFKEAFEKATPTIYNIPVVGNWVDAKNNFGGHDVVLETEGNKIKFKSKTIPYGVVPESCNPRWEEVTDEYGNTKNYFTVDVILWKERYSEQIEKVENDGVNQSMEIMVTDGDWDENYDYFDVNDFYFSALCLLGRDRNEHGEKGEDDIEPCFENAEVTTYSFDKEIFQKEFNFMLGEINKITKESNNVEFINEGGEEQVKNENIEKVEENNEEFKLDTNENVGETAEVENIKIENSNDEDLKIEAAKENIEVVESQEIQNENIIIDSNLPKEDFKLKYEELSVKFSELQIFRNQLEQSFNELKLEVENLRKYKQNIENEKLRQEKEQVFTDYSLILDENEMKEVKDNIDSYSIEEIQKKLAVIYSIKSINNAKKEKQPKEVVMAVENLKTVEKSNEEVDRFAVK